MKNVRNFYVLGIYNQVDFLMRGDIVDSVRMGWNWTELRDRLTILVIAGTRTDEHFFRSQVEIGLEPDCLSW